MSRKKASLNHEALILDSIRYRNKANWYRVRFMIGRKDALEDYMVVELDLTRGKFDAIAANFYDSTDMALARRYASRFIEAIFNVTIPDEWK